MHRDEFELLFAVICSTKIKNNFNKFVQDSTENMQNKYKPHKHLKHQRH